MPGSWLGLFNRSPEHVEDKRKREACSPRTRALLCSTWAFWFLLTSPFSFPEWEKPNLSFLFHSVTSALFKLSSGHSLLFAVGVVLMGCQFSTVLQGNQNNNEAVQVKQSFRKVWLRGRLGEKEYFLCSRDLKIGGPCLGCLRSP